MSIYVDRGKVWVGDYQGAYPGIRKLGLHPYRKDDEVCHPMFNSHGCCDNPPLILRSWHSTCRSHIVQVKAGGKLTATRYRSGWFRDKRHQSFPQLLSKCNFTPKRPHSGHVDALKSWLLPIFISPSSSSLATAFATGMLRVRYFFHDSVVGYCDTAAVLCIMIFKNIRIVKRIFLPGKKPGR